MEIKHFAIVLFFSLCLHGTAYCQDAPKGKERLKSDISIALKIVSPRMELDTCARMLPGREIASSLTSLQAAECLVYAVGNFSKTNIVECSGGECASLRGQTVESVYVWSSGLDTNGDYWDLALLTTSQDNMYFALKIKERYKNSANVVVAWEVKGDNIVHSKQNNKESLTKQNHEIDMSLLTGKQITSVTKMKAEYAACSPQLIDDLKRIVPQTIKNKRIDGSVFYEADKSWDSKPDYQKYMTLLGIAAIEKCVYKNRNLIVIEKKGKEVARIDSHSGSYIIQGQTR